jgi:uncharacterized protein YcfJ
LGDPVNWVDTDGLSSTAAGAIFGGTIGEPPGAVAGAIVGTAIGVGVGVAGNWIWDQFFSESSDDEGENTQNRLPTGSRGINQTPWSGDHGEIKDNIGAGPDDNVFIDPNDHVWGENPDGTYTDHGPAGVFTGSGKPSGKCGKDRKGKRNKGRERRR